MKPLTVTLPYPPSVNRYWRHPTKGPLAGRHLVSEHGRGYREAIRNTALIEAWPRFEKEARLKVAIDAYMPDRRRRDLDNVLKAVFDSLTHAELWGDDSQIDSLTIVRVPTLGGMLKVTVEQIQPQPALEAA